MDIEAFRRAVQKAYIMTEEISMSRYEFYVLLQGIDDRLEIAVRMLSGFSGARWPGGRSQVLSTYRRWVTAWLYDMPIARSWHELDNTAIAIVSQAINTLDPVELAELLRYVVANQPPVPAERVQSWERWANYVRQSSRSESERYRQGAT